MKIIRFEDASGKIQTGQWLSPTQARLIEGDLFGPYQASSQTVAIKRLLAPVAPVNLIAIGLNYRRHAAETGIQAPEYPLVFIKLTTSIIASGEPIVLPADAPNEVDYEAELAVVIGKTARKVSPTDALNYVLGYTCANDVSARDCQFRRDKQWARAKSFDTFCPLGPCLVVEPAMNPNTLYIRTKLNGQMMQNSNTADMIFSVPDIVSYLSQHFTLLPGTVILTGTPEGVGSSRKPPRFLQAGDTIAIEIDGIGELVNPVRSDS